MHKGGWAWTERRQPAGAGRAATPDGIKAPRALVSCARRCVVIVIGVVVLAAALHACWNAIVKSIDDRLSVMAVLGLSSVLVCLPIALLAPAPRGAALPFLAGSIAVHGVYTLLLVGLYADSEFNQVYPLARGISPPTVALFAVLVVGERLSRLQVAGLAVLSIGLLGVAARGGGRTRRRDSTRRGD